MKNTVKILSLVMLTAMAAVACTKTENDVNDSIFTHRVTILASQVETKTVIDEGTDEASFAWSADDASRFVVKENSVQGTNVQLALSNSNKTATLSATFNTEPADQYVYSAFLAANLTGSDGDTNRKPKIPATQNPTVSSYDPDADVLVAKSQTFKTTQDKLNMQFARPVVINKMTLKGLTAGETVSTVVVSGGDKQIIGYYTIDSDTWSGQGKEIKVNINRAASSTGQLVVYFVTMPVEDVTLTVTATTTENIYSKTFAKPISFVENQETVFSVNSMTKTQKANYTGTYVLTNVDGNKMANKWTGNNIPAVNVSLENSIIYYDPDVLTLSEAQITVTRITDSQSDYYNMYTMVQNGKYLYAASNSNNYLKGKDEPDVNAYWEISETDGVWSIVASKSENRNILRFNTTFFSCYNGTSTGTAPVLFKVNNNVKTTPVINSSTDKISLDSDAVETWTELNAGVAFNNDATTTTATAYDDEACTTTCTWLSVDIDETVVYKVTANNTGAERTAYIKIVATNNEGRSVSKVLEVTQNYAGAVLETWTLIDKIENLTEGDYIMCAVVGEKYHAWTGGIKDGKFITEEATYNSNKTLDFVGATTVTLIGAGTDNAYYIKWISGSYTDYLTSGSNTSLKYTSTMETESWTASNASTGIFLTGSVNSGIIKSATTASSQFIRSYASTNTGTVGVVFFKKDN